MRILLVWAAALTLFSSPSSAQTLIPDRETCATCVLTFDTVAVLGGSLDSAPPDMVFSVVQLPDQSYWLGAIGMPGTLYHYAADGAYLGEFESVGRGPDEAERLYTIQLIGNSHSGFHVVAYDGGSNNRFAVVDLGVPAITETKSLEQPRGQRLPLSGNNLKGIRWIDGDLWISSPDMIDYYGVVRYRLATGELQQVVQAPGDLSIANSRHDPIVEAFRRITPGPSGVWVTSLNDYRAWLFTPDGEEIGSWSRDPEWNPLGVHAPENLVDFNGIFEVQPGIVVTFNTDYGQEGWERPSIVEVISGGEVLLRQTFPGEFVDIVQGAAAGTFAVATLSDDGIPQVVIYRASLTF